MLLALSSNFLERSPKVPLQLVELPGELVVGGGGVGRGAARRLSEHGVRSGRNKQHHSLPPQTQRVSEGNARPSLQHPPAD